MKRKLREVLEKHGGVGFKSSSEDGINAIFHQFEIGVNTQKHTQRAVSTSKIMQHSKKDAYQGAYDRAKLPKERKKIMEAWGKYCYSLMREKAKKAAWRHQND